MNKNPFEEYQDDNTIIIGKNVTFGDKVFLNIKGKGHHIYIGDNATLRNLAINIIGDKNKVSIGAGCNIRGALHIRQPNSSLILGSRVTSVTAHIFAMEGKSIHIGDNSMLSSGIYIRTSDEHPIFDLESGLRINEAKDVIIGKSVWIAEGVTINKGAEIPDGCIIGSCSVVLGKLSRPKSIYAGIPASLVREGVIWERHLPITN